jgi:type VI secretion system lysozyme-like protein
MGAVDKGLLACMTSGAAPAKIILSSSAEGNLTEPKHASQTAPLRHAARSHRGEPLNAYDDRALECMSVRRNVQRILNKRSGALKHLPDYDLPDLTNIYKALPASARLLKEQMEATLLRYEPRIRAIDVDIPENDDPGA